jgi:hypothetical protein
VSGAGVESSPWDRRRSRRDLIPALEVTLAIVVLLLVVSLFPRPSIRIVSVRFETSACDQLASSSMATAYLSLANSGTSDGIVYVLFNVDGVRSHAEPFIVPARTTIDRSMSVTIMDCSSHRYAVDLCFPIESTPC